ncbi:MAG: hypothetical protein KAY24_00200 [Candidatus Eisenbacteria sp.]|nr:hypothetical protein [Candidatus Eisenbacteria bacterium]
MSLKKLGWKPKGKSADIPTENVGETNYAELANAEATGSSPVKYEDVVVPSGSLSDGEGYAVLEALPSGPTHVVIDLPRGLFKKLALLILAIALIAQFGLLPKAIAWTQETAVSSYTWTVDIIAAKKLQRKDSKLLADMVEWSELVAKNTCLEIVAVSLHRSEDGKLLTAEYAVAFNDEEYTALSKEESDLHWEGAHNFLLVNTVNGTDVTYVVFIYTFEKFKAPRSGEPLYQLAFVGRYSRDMLAEYFADEGRDINVLMEEAVNPQQAYMLMQQVVMFKGGDDWTWVGGY